jgi:hypothetical protein
MSSPAWPEHATWPDGAHPYKLLSYVLSCREQAAQERANQLEAFTCRRAPSAGFILALTRIRVWTLLGRTGRRSRS